MLSLIGGKTRLKGGSAPYRRRAIANRTNSRRAHPALLKQWDAQLGAPPASRQDGPRTPASAGNEHHTERLRLADLRRYEQVALKAVKAGKPMKAFDSDAIAPAALATLRERLGRCETADEVRAIFADAERAAATPDYPESDHWVTINSNPVLIPAPHATQRAAVEANLHPVLEHAAR